MQISKIQNNTYVNTLNKAANSPISFGIKTLRAKAEKQNDVFEHHVSQDRKASNDQATANVIYTNSKGKPFKGTFSEKDGKLYHKYGTKEIPYNGLKTETFDDGKSVQTKYIEGSPFIINDFKGDKLQRVEYYGGIKNADQNLTSVTLFQDGKHDFAIFRNHGEQWQKAPRLDITYKTQDGVNSIQTELPTDSNPVSAFKVTTGTDGFVPIRHFLLIGNDGSLYCEESKDGLQALLGAVAYTKNTIQSDDYKANFGTSEKYNHELDKVQEFLEAELKTAED